MSTSALFPMLSDTERLQRLAAPPATGRLPIVIDTDPYNEIDDQFAITHAMLSPDRFDIKAIYAAPFANERSGFEAGHGMEKSFLTAQAVLQRLNASNAANIAPLPAVYRGAAAFATAPDDPSGFRGQAIASEATSHLIELARAQPDDAPLYVVAIAAITNIASAIFLAPDIIRKIVLVWLGGHPHHYYDTNEFNLRQDPFASRVVLDCGVPLVLIPCFNVTEHLTLTTNEVKTQVAPHGEIGRYLAHEFVQYAHERGADSRAIWDMGPFAWLLDARAVETVLIPTPILGTSPQRAHGYFAPHLHKAPRQNKSQPAHCAWSLDPRRHLMREAFRVYRDPIFADFYRKLAM
ncbi:MAG: nucleoside hydrolase [Anaerolineae bacterium]|nr:nucleoside hydrolase [Anaerolineae bacterium]